MCARKTSSSRIAPKERIAQVAAVDAQLGKLVDAQLEQLVDAVTEWKSEWGGIVNWMGYYLSGRLGSQAEEIKQVFRGKTEVGREYLTNVHTLVQCVSQISPQDLGQQQSEELWETIFCLNQELVRGLSVLECLDFIHVAT